MIPDPTNPLFLALSYALQLAVIVRALTRPEREPASRLAWVLVILAVPALGVALYLLLGEVNPGRVLRARIHAVRQKLPTVPATSALVPQAAVPDVARAVFGRAAAVNGFAPLAGNRATLTADSNDAIARMIEDVDRAADSVHIGVYIWLDDTNGRALAQAVMRAARRGVTCRCMVDGLGSRLFLRSQTWRQMRAAGVRTGIAFPTNWAALRLLIGRIDIRNHRKLVVIDTRIAYCGSQNIADPEFTIKARYAPWVDIMLRLTGPVCWQMQHLFVNDWMAQTGEDIGAVLEPPVEPAPGDEAPIDEAPIDEVPGDETIAGGADSGEAGASDADGSDPEGGGDEGRRFVALAFGTGPGISLNAVPDVVGLALASARREVVITTPYFVPTLALEEQIRATALRGVSVTLIVPRRNDSRFVAWASRASYPLLLRAGVRICEFAPGLLHAKTLTVDGVLSLIGSANLDRRSFDLNYENAMLIADASVSATIRARQFRYLDSSTPVDRAEVEGWNLGRRLLFNLAATISPVL